jgi:hypothetical protein
MSPAQTIINSSCHAYHFLGGKVNGHVVALIETPDNLHGSHAVMLIAGDMLHQLPSMPEDTARRAFWELIHQLQARA